MSMSTPPDLTVSNAAHGDCSVAAVIARFLKAQGVARLFTLCGGHIMPIYMQAHAAGIRIVDVRDERAAVYMAQAHAELTGELGVALVTAGPGVTNAMTGIANAHIARAPVLVLSGTPPRAQDNRGALQDLPHTELLRPITRYARTVRDPLLVLQELGEALARATGQGGDPGPVYLDFPTDVLRAEVPRHLQLAEHFTPRKRPVLAPDSIEAAQAMEILWAAHRPLVISGRGARGAGPVLTTLLDRSGALYLDTGESRGLVPDEHPSVVAAMRGSVMAEADVVVTLGRRLDFQLAYGSPAVFGSAQFIRIADAPSELRDNRRGAVELFAQPAAALAAMLAAAGDRPAAASLAYPGRQVIVATGDGAFGFNAMEIDSAVRHEAKLLIIVANNGAWQIEVNDQTERFGQVVGTRLQFADHAAMARAFGMHAQRVERIEDLDAAIVTALQHLPALLDVVVSTDARSCDSRSGLAWVPDLQAIEAWDVAERGWRAQA